jgi:hypothetical protein
MDLAPIGKRCVARFVRAPGARVRRRCAAFFSRRAIHLSFS